jgi:DNA polymerase III epsilon subunit-like protein
MRNEASRLVRDFFISVDVEAAGPNPSDYSLLAIGACTVSGAGGSFYVELQPVNDNYLPEALRVNGLSMEKLKEEGLPPREALERFAAWTARAAPPGHAPVFTAFNAPFDWMFVNDYFQRYLGENPFGHSALDIKSFFMGLTGSPWSETAMGRVARRYLGGRQLSHHALRDAQDQAELFRLMLAESKVAPSRT